MTNLINLERDMFWSNIFNRRSWSAGNQWMANNCLVGGAGNVEQTHNGWSSVPDKDETLAKSVGCAMIGPLEDDWTPFRVKGGGTGVETAFGYGYADGGWSQGDDTISACRFFAVGRHIDEIVVVPPIAEGEAHHGSPIVFFAHLRAGSVMQMSFCSIQRMVGKPNQYAAGVR